MNRSVFRLARVLHNHISNVSHSPVLLCRTFAYKSSLSLNKLYPESSLQIKTLNFVPEDPNEKFSGYIPVEQLDITYSRSSGPGGQNVNKVNTKVDVRFKVSKATWLDSTIRDKLIEEHKNKLTIDGYLVVKSETTRSQQLNLADCMRKLRAIIRKAGETPAEPSPETVELHRKKKEKAAKERLLVKRQEAQRRSDKRPDTLNDL